MNEALDRMRALLDREGIGEARGQPLIFWARKLLEYSDRDDPAGLDRAAMERFLEHIANERYAGRPTQDRALEAAHWLFRSSPGGTPPWLELLLDQRRRTTGPGVLSREEVRRLLGRLGTTEWLAAALVYGSGIRLIECVRLRIRDVDPESRRVTVRDPADTVLRELRMPAAVARSLAPRMEELRQLHIQDVSNGAGHVSLPPEIARTQPNAALAWRWQYLFPARPGAARYAADTERRPIHHVDPARIHRAIAQAAHAAGIHRRVTGHVLRNSYAVHMIQRGMPVKQVEVLLGAAGAPARVGGPAPAGSCMEIPDAPRAVPLVPP